MSLEATHLRFALDLKDKYQVKDIEKYLAGAVYPDSRYVTGIDRILTHPQDYEGWHWETADDFKKGWFVHLLIDKVQWQVIKEELPDLFPGDYSRNSEDWARHTAIKILQDIDDVKKFNIQEYLPCLKFIGNPNGEDIEKIKESNQVISRLYVNPDELDINNYRELWEKFGIDDELIQKLIDQAEQYRADTEIMAIIGGLYQKTITKLNGRQSTI